MVLKLLPKVVFILGTSDYKATNCHFMYWLTGWDAKQEMEGK